MATDKFVTATDSQDRNLVKLRLYVAGSTPNSVRAQQNLSIFLDGYKDFDKSSLEIIDVFTNPKRAMTDNVIVTPTLMGVTASRRVVMLGDLADRDLLEGLFRSIFGSP